MLGTVAGLAAAAGVGALATLALEGLGTAAAGMLAAVTEQGVAGEQLCLPCAFRAGGIAGALTVLTLGVGRVPAVQRVAGRLAAVLAESRVGLWAKALPGQLGRAAERAGLRRSAVATAEEVAQRRAVAIQSYRDQGFPDERIGAHLRGIDFNHPVEGDHVLRRGTIVEQWQVPGGRQGTYYANPGARPTALGINPQSEDRVTGAILDRVRTRYLVTEDVRTLRSTAAPIIDDWSIAGRPFQTDGGATQFFTTNSAVFTPVPPP